MRYREKCVLLIFDDISWWKSSCSIY